MFGGRGNVIQTTTRQNAIKTFRPCCAGQCLTSDALNKVSVCDVCQLLWCKHAHDYQFEPRVWCNYVKSGRERCTASFIMRAHSGLRGTWAEDVTCNHISVNQASIAFCPIGRNAEQTKGMVTIGNRRRKNKELNWPYLSGQLSRKREPHLGTQAAPLRDTTHAHGGCMKNGTLLVQLKSLITRQLPD